MLPHTAIYLYVFIYFVLSLCGSTHVGMDAPEARRGHALASLEVGSQAVMSQSTWVWEPNSGPLQEQQMLLTTKPSLQPQDGTLKVLIFQGLFCCCFCFVLRQSPTVHPWLVRNLLCKQSLELRVLLPECWD